MRSPAAILAKQTGEEQSRQVLGNEWQFNLSFFSKRVREKEV